MSTTTLKSSDYPTIQDAINALPAGGGVVEIPAGTFAQTTTLSLPTNKPVRLVGAGPKTTKLTWSATNIDYVLVQGDFQVLESLAIHGPGSGSGRGVVIGRTGNPATEQQRNVDIIDCIIEETGSWGLYGVGTISPDPANSLLSYAVNITKTLIQSTHSNGAVRVGTGCTAWTFRDMNIGQFTGYGYFLQSSNVICFDSCGWSAPNDNTQAYLHIKNCAGITLINADFENSNDTQTQFFIKLEGDLNSRILLDNCNFSRLVQTGHTGSGQDSARVIQVPSGSPTVAVHGLAMINTSIYLDVTTVTGSNDIDLSAATCDSFIAGGLLSSKSGYSVPRIVRSTTAKVVLANSNRRLSMPRLTQTEISALTDLAAGDMVYQTDGTPGPRVCDGTGWISIWLIDVAFLGNAQQFTEGQRISGGSDNPEALNLTPYDGGERALVVTAKSGQSGNLADFVDSGGHKLLSVEAGGTLLVSNFVALYHGDLTASDKVTLVADLISGSRTQYLPNQSGTHIVKVGTDVFLAKVTPANTSGTLISSPLAGMYELTYLMLTTTSSGAGSPTAQLAFGWTDDYGAETKNITPVLDLSTAGSQVSGTLPIQVASGNITYAITIANAAGSPKYTVMIRVRAL